jgi:hypothetical protein
MSDSKEDVRVIVHCEVANAASDGTRAWWKVVQLMSQQADLMQATRDEAAAAAGCDSAGSGTTAAAAGDERTATAGGDSAVTTAAVAGDERTATAGGDSAVATSAAAGDETTGGWSWSRESWQSWLQLELMWQELWRHLEMLKETKVWSEHHERMQNDQMRKNLELQAKLDDVDLRLRLEIRQRLLHEEELRQTQQDDRARAQQMKENTHEEFQMMQHTLEHLQRRQLAGRPAPSSALSSWNR